MSIGIYDADLANYLWIPWNLQVMKLSAYYKKKREIVILAKDFTPERNKQFFYVKDWSDDNLPNMSNTTNVTYLGHSFSDQNYIALDEDIESVVPDTSIYSTMESEYSKSNFGTKLYRMMSAAEHCRLSLDNKTIWNNYMSQFHDLDKAKIIIFHDYDLGKIEHSFDTVQDILKNCKKDYRAPRIGMKFPINISTSEELFQWSSLKANEIFYSLQYNGVINTHDFYLWAAAGKTKQTYALLDYMITGKDFDEDYFVKHELREIFKQILISRSYRLKITLKYNKNFFVNPLWPQVIDLMNYYQHSMLGCSEYQFLHNVQNDTMYDFAKKTLTTYGKYPSMFIKDDIKQIFHNVGDQSPELFKDFYELSWNKLREEL